MDRKENVKLSIIIPTIGRVTELKDLLLSIVDACLPFNFEIIIIDQNEKGFLQDMLIEFENKLPINHCIVPFKGLSKAKNFGFSLSAGEFVSFPDDDCKIFKETFENALSEIHDRNLDIVFGKCIDEDGNDSVLNFKKESTFLDRRNMLGGFVEATVISKREIFDEYKFDENMGAGCFFGAEEGYDWLYRVFSEERPNKVMFSPRIEFYHPQVIFSKGDYSSLNRVFKYRCGTAYLCNKHNFWFKYYKRVILSSCAYYFFYFINKNNSTYYKTEMLALRLGKIFAKKNSENVK